MRQKLGDGTAFWFASDPDGERDCVAAEVEFFARDSLRDVICNADLEDGSNGVSVFGQDR